jgi:hypothetical protein
LRQLLAKHHHAIAKTLDRQAESMDDGAEHKAVFSKLAGHHRELAKALLEPPSNDPHMPDVGSEDWRGRGGDLDGPKALSADDLAKMFEL